MSDQKKKKWGLSKSFEYDMVKPIMGESKVHNKKHDEEIIMDNDDSPDKRDNKVTVNPRLKELLFD